MSTFFINQKFKNVYEHVTRGFQKKNKTRYTLRDSSNCIS